MSKTTSLLRQSQLINFNPSHNLLSSRTAVTPSESSCWWWWWRHSFEGKVLRRLVHHTPLLSLLTTENLSLRNMSSLQQLMWLCTSSHRCIQVISECPPCYKYRRCKVEVCWASVKLWQHCSLPLQSVCVWRMLWGFLNLWLNHL